MCPVALLTQQPRLILRDFDSGQLATVSLFTHAQTEKKKIGKKGTACSKQICRITKGTQRPEKRKEKTKGYGYKSKLNSKPLHTVRDDVLIAR